MARDIKFRAWFRPTTKYKADYVDRYGEELPDLEVEYYTEEAFLDDSWVDTDNYESIIFEQYTGLKDKNGKEIYEGDIIKVSDKEYPILNGKNLVVKFDVLEINEYSCDRMSGWMVETSNWSDSLLDVVTCKQGCEIIGNIHEMPELLEGEKDG